VYRSVFLIKTSNSTLSRSVDTLSGAKMTSCPVQTAGGDSETAGSIAYMFSESGEGLLASAAYRSHFGLFWATRVLPLLARRTFQAASLSSSEYSATATRLISSSA
jgi:hypothetical protein